MREVIEQTTRADVEQILHRIHLYRINTNAQFQTVILGLGEYITQHEFKLCIVDSIATHLRRYQNSIEHLKTIRKICQAMLRNAARFNIPILRTNTITSNGPSLGETFGHTSTIRVEFKRGNWRIEKGDEGTGTFEMDVSTHRLTIGCRAKIPTGKRFHIS
jgi:hypothetical protein